MIISVAMIIIKIGYLARLLNRGRLNSVDDNRQSDDVNHHEAGVIYLADEVDCLRVIGNRLRLEITFIATSTMLTIVLGIKSVAVLIVSIALTMFFVSLLVVFMADGRSKTAAIIYSVMHIIKL